MPYGYPGAQRSSAGSSVASVLIVVGVFFLVGIVVAAAVFVDTPGQVKDLTAAKPPQTYAATSSEEESASTTEEATGTTEEATTTERYSKRTTSESSDSTLTGRTRYTPTPERTTTRYETSRTRRSRYTRTTRSTPPRPKPVMKLGDNPVLGGDNGLPNTKCNYPNWAPNVAAARAFSAAQVDCLNKMWKPMLERANLPFSIPKIEVYTRAAQASSPCGGSNAPAFYCSRNETIYMGLQEGSSRALNDVMVFMSMLGHEYGHHIQKVSGLLKMAHQKRYQAGRRSAAGLAVSRRNELNATCFGGMFIGSSNAAGTVNNAQAGRARYDAAHRGDYGDVRDHGAPANNGRWFDSGYLSNRSNKCNTWTAPANTVS